MSKITGPEVVALTDRYRVEMPIAEQVHAVCFEGLSAVDAYRNLPGRPHRSEIHRLGD